MIYLSKSLDQTQNIAKKILGGLSGQNVLALMGDLGSGKTTFVQALGKVLGIKQRVVSPTFILMRSYKIPLVIRKTGSDSSFKHLYHLDLYRLNSWGEVKTLGIEEIWADPKNLVCIEWAEKIELYLPKKYMRLEFEYLDENLRRITLS